MPNDKATSEAPLNGLRVLETATGIAGPYAGRLLAMSGATVVKVEPFGGDPARFQPVDDEPLTGLSPLFVHLNAGKKNVAAEDVDPTWAHVVIDDRVRRELEGSPYEPSALSTAAGPRLVSVTPWGFEAERSGGIAEELLVQAASGVLGFNRDPDKGPLRLPGWQSQYFAGASAATAALSLLRTDAVHVDVPWLDTFLTSVELVYADALQCERPRTPVGPNPPSAFPSGALPCKDGHVTPGSLRAVDWEMQCLLYGLPELVDDPEYTSRQKRVAHVDELWQKIKPWYAERTKREIFQFSLDTPWSVGMVMKPTDALADDHLEARGFLGEVATADGPRTAPVLPFHDRGMPVADHGVAETGADETPRRYDAGGGERPDLRRLEGMRLIEMTVAWAGPYVGNLLAPLGVDVIKIEAQSPFDGWRMLRAYDHGMPPGKEQMALDNRFFDASGLFNAVNRNKRTINLSLGTEEGKAAFLELVAQSDGIVANFSAGVLPNLGLDWETLSKVNPGLVVVRMPAFGVKGPYADVAGYGSVVEGMSGVGHRQGYESEEARISNLYYPDPVAGIHAAFALLAGLDRRDRTGHGTEIDLSHQDVVWMQHGEALVLAAESGRDIGRMGNREPGVPNSGFWQTSDDQWVAVVAPASCTELLADAANRTAEELIGLVDEAGGQAVLTLDPWTAPHVSPIRERLEVVDHATTGAIRYLKPPLRFDGAEPPAGRPAPRFDEYTDEVLRDLLGYDDTKIAELREARAIGGKLPPPAKLGLHFDV